MTGKIQGFGVFSKALKGNEDTLGRQFESDRGYLFIFKNKNIIGDKMAEEAVGALGEGRISKIPAGGEGRAYIGLSVDGSETTGGRILPIYKGSDEGST